MIKKTIWLLVSCIMVVSLVICSCGGDTTEEVDEGAVSTSEAAEYGGNPIPIATETRCIFQTFITITWAGLPRTSTRMETLLKMCTAVIPSPLMMKPG